MGLAMISAIKDFDDDRDENVNMRVGIHTGTVLCGIVGKRRFKFDVWSNDVSLANKMESTGKPGMVHVSEKTYSFLKEEYFVQEGDRIGGKNKIDLILLSMFNFYELIMTELVIINFLPASQAFVN